MIFWLSRGNSIINIWLEWIYLRRKLPIGYILLTTTPRNWDNLGRVYIVELVPFTQTQCAMSSHVDNVSERERERVQFIEVRWWIPSDQIMGFYVLDWMGVTNRAELHWKIITYPNVNCLNIIILWPSKRNVESEMVRLIIECALHFPFNTRCFMDKTLICIKLNLFRNMDILQ